MITQKKLFHNFKAVTYRYQKESEVTAMKKKKLSMVILTLVIAGIGAGMLLWSTNWIMADVQKDVESSEDIVATEDTESLQALAGKEEELREKIDNLKDFAALEEALEEATGGLGIELPAGLSEEQEIEMLQEALLVLLLEGEECHGVEVPVTFSIATAEFVYYGQDVLIKDDLVEKETAIENAQKIMDFIFDDVDKTILTPYGIDKTAYTYDIQRQDDEDKSLCYGVFLKKDGNIECTIGICIEDEITMDAFARDGLIDLYGDVENPIPEEYLVENWCSDTQKKEEIYDAYYESSKEIIENVLGLAPIDDTFCDVSKDSCFHAGNDWSTVRFGYRLTDGTEISVFYNRINQMWDGFSIQ